MAASGLGEQLRAWTNPEYLYALLPAIGRVILVAAMAYVIGTILIRAADSSFRRLQGRHSFFNAERTESLRRLTRSMIRFGTAVGALVVILTLLGVNVWTLVLDATLRGYVYALLLVIAAHLVIRVGGLLIDEIFERAESDVRMLDPTRAVTLRGLLKSVLRYTVDIGAIILVLSNLGVNTTGLVASVGIASLAIGFGAQNLVRDVISGFFILFEDQFRVGEHIETDGVSGIVEEMGFRVTKIRDFGGQLHILPNGRIEKLTNYSRGPMRVMFDVRIAYEEDIDRAIRVLEQVVEAYGAQDPRIVEGPKVLGVADLGESSVMIRIWAKAQSGEQWDVERQLRRAIKEALDKAGIAVPYPRQVWVPASPSKMGAMEGAQPHGVGSGSSDRADNVQRPVGDSP